ncbi:hypothetical protein BCV72DRAFT_322274 [Rhizopus microsporus var. microsporus]|uniref:Cas12f1-like TNB domain-containing protein n=1 Tax=Rhizopus microsporus var. microsporus TaxID=86635 RepID=A0A1X0QNE6_RHIZD|nr:hypothetical protein BCV72DRAFT_322274 [Rhizopus microsporus var. microsporus]
MEHVPSKDASKAYVYRKLRELPFTSVLSKKKFNSLREEALHLINSDKTFAPGKKLAKLTPQQLKQEYKMARSLLLNALTKEGVVFSIAPIYSVQTKSNQIDAQSFWRLGRKPNDLTDFYYQLFNFTKLGFRTRDNLPSGKKFRNVITTEDHSVSFLFTRTVKRSLATTKNPSDFIDDIRNGCDVWGIDPGVSTILTSVDTSGRQSTTSLDEYYHLCGYNNANFIRKKHQEQHTAQFLKISNLSSLKTSNVTEFAKACKTGSVCMMILQDTVMKMPAKFCRSSKLKFQCYIRKQKGVHEICKRLMHGSMKYNKKTSTGAKTPSAENESKYCPPAPLDHPDKPRKTIITFGDDMFNSSLRGNRGASVRLIKKALQKYCGNQLEICMVDEYLTSQICNRCKNRNMDNIVTEKSKRRVHKILKCKQNTCNIVWSRDIMAAHNILDMFLFAARNNNQRFDVFTRQGASNDQPSV